ncbi:MAG: DUF1294 domain-containing protein [Eubacterium sp.]|nr:DUF1294 domain-containing protein [Eubacterium sp.]
MWWQWLLLAYIGVISLIGFILPAVDKRKAKKDKWRIQEKTLFIVSLLGGSAAMYISMRIFHHKTKHKRFMIGIPLIIVLQAAAIFAVWFFLLK